MMLRLATLFFPLIVCVPSSMATVITFTFEGTIDGEIDSNAFLGESFVLTATADTDDIVPFSAGPDFGFDLQPTTVVIGLPNLNGGTILNVTDPTFLSVNNGNNTFGFGDQNFFFGAFLTDAVFASYDMQSSLGPVTSPGTTNSFPVFATDGGDFVFANGSPSLTLTAVLIPEPTSVGLLAVAVLGTALRRRRD
ncbi:MAG: PEP-CTERM sorting domain-containing protein [Verrucomicrobiota bacterium]